MMYKNRPIRLDDLAKKLKVSKVTVSKALRDHPDISPATKARVKELAEKLGYMPNLMARNLSSRNSNTIGLVIPKIAHLFFAPIIESIYDITFKNNYETFLTVSQEQEQREKKHILSLLSMRVDGLLVSVTQDTQDIAIFKRVIDQNVPIVFVDRVPPMEGISSVTVDDRGGAYAATVHAIKKGHKKIAHIGGFQHINIGRERKQGFLDAMNEYNVPINPEWIIEGGFGEEDGYNGFLKMFDKKNYPTFILVATYPGALGIYKAAQEVGIRIPEDIEITCFGITPFNMFFPSVFNFVEQPAVELGRQAFNLLLQMIKDPNKFEPKNIILQTRLLLNTNKGLITEIA